MPDNYVEILVKDRDQAKPDMEALRARLKELGGMVETARANVDDADGAATLDKLKAQLTELGHRTENPKIKMSGALRAEAQVHAIEASLHNLDDEVARPRRFSMSGLLPSVGEMSMAQKAMMGLNVATTFAEPLIAGVTVAAGGLASGMAAAGAGLGVFGAVAKSVYSQVSTAVQSWGTATSTTGKAAATAMKQYRAELASLPPSQREVARSIISMKTEWQSFVQSNTAGVSQIMSQGIGLLPKLLGLMQPFLAPTEHALSSIIAKVKTRLGSSSFIHEIGDFAKASGPDLEKVAAATGHVAMGILGILHAFLPASSTILSGLDNWTAKFERWGQTLSSHSGFQSLMQMFRTETPLAMHALGQLGGIIKTVVADMTGLSGAGNSKMLLEMANPILSLANALMKANPDLVRFALYALAAGSGIKKMNSMFGEGSGFASLVNGVKGGVGALKDMKSGFSDAEMAAADATGIWGTFGGKISTAVEAIKGWSIWSTIASGATKVWTGVQAAFDAVMDANPIALIVIAVVALVAAIVLMVTHLHETAHIFDMVRHAGAEAFDAVRHAVAEALDWIRGHWPLLLAILTGPFGMAVLFVRDHWRQITQAVSDTLDWIRGHWPLLLAILTGPIGLAVLYIVDHWHQILTGAETMIHDVVSWFERLPGMIVSAVGNLGHLLWSAGQQVLEGLLGGIESMVGAVVHAAASVGSSIIGSIKGALGLGSPSRIAFQQARDLWQGHINGAESMRGALTAQAARMARSAIPGLGGAGGAQGGYGAGGGRMELTLRFEGGDGPLVKALFQQLKGEVRIVGGGGPNSVQRALGQGT